MRTVLALLLVTGSVYGDVIHVPVDYPTIQQAINFSSKGDEIVVAPGTYNEVIDFSGKNIVVRSFGGADVTTIDGSGLNESVVTLVGGEGPEAVLQGFTITGGASGRGGGLYVLRSDPTISQCLFVGNTAIGVGGGAYLNQSSSRIVDCAFIGNHAGAAGAIYTTDQIGQQHEQVLTNILFAGNSVAQRGAAMYIGYGNYVLDGLTFTENSGPDHPISATIEVAIPSVILSNSIMWANSTSNEVFSTVDLGGLTIEYCDIEGGVSAIEPVGLVTWGQGNIAEDPEFAVDYRLHHISPCIDAGDNGLAGSDTDLDGNPRIVDGDDDGKATVDMGAYEFQACMADFDGDGAVRVPDLLFLLGEWGGNPDSPADFDSDGQVRVPDLIVLLGSWGICA